MSLFPELASLAQDFSLRAYYCNIRYNQFDFKPGVYSVSLFYNFTSAKKGDSSHSSKDSQRRTPIDGLDFDIASYIDQKGVEVSVLPMVGLFSSPFRFTLLVTERNHIMTALLLLFLLIAMCSWVFSQWVIVTDILFFLIVSLQIAFLIVDGFRSCSFFLRVHLFCYST